MLGEGRPALRKIWPDCSTSSQQGSLIDEVMSILASGAKRQVQQLGRHLPGSGAPKEGVLQDTI